MEENRELLALLQKIEKHNRQQLWVTRMLCLGLLAAVLVCAFVFVQLFPMLSQVDGILEQAQSVLGDLEETTKALAQADLGGMVKNVDTLVRTGQESLDATMEKLNSIDFDALNSAIANLSAVVDPLAKFFNVFR